MSAGTKPGALTSAPEKPVTAQGWLFSESLLETRVCPGHLQELGTLPRSVYRTLLPSHLPSLSSGSFGEAKAATLALHGSPVVMWLTLPPSPCLLAGRVGADEKKQSTGREKEESRAEADAQTVWMAVVGLVSFL